MVLERNSSVGAFFQKFPIHRQLIRYARHCGNVRTSPCVVSINKRYTGRSEPEFNLRHDWHSVSSFSLFSVECSAFVSCMQLLYHEEPVTREVDGYESFPNLKHTQPTEHTWAQAHTVFSVAVFQLFTRLFPRCTHFTELS